MLQFDMSFNNTLLLEARREGTQKVGYTNRSTHAKTGEIVPQLRVLYALAGDKGTHGAFLSPTQQFVFTVILLSEDLIPSSGLHGIKSSHNA